MFRKFFLGWGEKLPEFELHVFGKPRIFYYQLPKKGDICSSMFKNTFVQLITIQMNKLAFILVIELVEIYLVRQYPEFDFNIKRIRFLSAILSQNCTMSESFMT